MPTNAATIRSYETVKGSWGEEVTRTLMELLWVDIEHVLSITDPAELMAEVDRRTPVGW